MPSSAVMWHLMAPRLPWTYVPALPHPPHIGHYLLPTDLAMEDEAKLTGKLGRVHRRLEVWKASIEESQSD